jgi:hypothetical protein
VAGNNQRRDVLTTDNAQAQATLRLGPEKILRLEPEGRAAAIDLDDWRAAVDQLVPLADADFATKGRNIRRRWWSRRFFS